MKAWLALALTCLLPALLAGCAQHQPAAADQPVETLTQADAAPGGWHAAAPPVSGWVPVKLHDLWARRWPHHDGVVWYRLQWNQANTDAPVGLLLDYVCMADEVWVNGSLIHRDPSLVEPLSRSWIAPQYFTLDQPLLHAGTNTLLVRVSGLAAYQPGMGPVYVGNNRAIESMYRQQSFWRYQIHFFTFALSAVLGVVFLMFWLLRRRETVFGWYALTTLFGAGNSWNFVASSPWPFADTNTWEAVNLAFFVASMATFCIFLLRFCERRWPRSETTLLIVAALTFILSFAMPGVVGPWRNAWALPMSILAYAATLGFLWHAARTPRVDLRVLAACLLIPTLISLHDFAVFMQLIPGSNFDWGAISSPLSLIGMSFAIAWRFSSAMRRVERFNIDLREQVEAATAELSATLSREHTLALAHTRTGERLNLVRDLHDGFGGSLIGAITELEQSPPGAETARTIATLKELRDDLRLVIDTTTHEQDTDLAGLLAPLRHRWSQRLEAASIDSRWQLECLENCRLGATRSLDLLRFLQESLTNVLKHSGARQVAIQLHCNEQRLQVTVGDDGHGFDLDNAHHGAGINSLRTRSTRLGGQLVIQTGLGQGTLLQLTCPGPTDPGDAKVDSQPNVELAEDGPGLHA